MAEVKEGDIGSQQPPAPALPAVTTRPAPVSETLPLQSKPRRLERRCWPSCACGEEGDGLNLTIGFFAIFTIAVTVALAVQIHYGAFEVIPHGSVTSDSQECSARSVDILRRGGNAVDAAVAAAFCMGVVNPHLTGLGGGGFLLVYDHKRRRMIDLLDFRETAPSAPPIPSTSPGDGSALVGVPGFLRGLQLAHSAHGSLPWREVLEPAIQLAREGVPVSQNLVDSKKKVGAPGALPGNEAFANFLEPLQPDVPLLQTRLADTLEVIADHGPDALYNGSLSTKLLSTVSGQSGMTLDDLAQYRAEPRRPLVSTIGDYTIMVPGAPSGGPLLLAVMGIFGTPVEHPQWWGPPYLQRLADTLRLSALYHAQLGDPDQSPDQVWNATQQMTAPHELETLRREVEEGGRAAWSNWQLPEPAGSFVGVIDNQEIYVAVVSGLNSQFGSRLMSPLGFLLNDALSNFTPRSATSSAAESSNVAAPGRRPLSLAVPAIVVRTGLPCGRRLVIGSPDAAVAAQTLLTILAREQQHVGPAVEEPRIVLRSKNLSTEDWHSPTLTEFNLTQLQMAGYTQVPMMPPYTAVDVAQKVADTLSAHADSRGGGGAISY